MNETRRLTDREHKQGYYVLACGCHAHVMRAELARIVPLDAIEECGGLPGVVRLDRLQEAIETDSER